jgi:hypothetical protein
VRRVATKSRVKTDQEYKELLGIEDEKTPEKVTHDASQYFDELRGSKQRKKENPFDKVVSVNQLKESLKESNPKYNVENIKKEIAKNQVETHADDYDKNSDVIISKPTNHTVLDEEAYKHNAQKLYNDLRKKNLSATEHINNIDDTTSADLLEPSTEINSEITSEPNSENPVSNDETTDVDSSDQPLLQPEVHNLDHSETESENIEEPISLDQIAQASDFTMENQNFLDQIKNGAANTEVAPVATDIHDDTSKIEDTNKIPFENNEENDANNKENEYEPYDFAKFLEDQESEDDSDGEYNSVAIENTDDLHSHLNTQISQLEEQVKVDDSTTEPSYTDNTQLNMPTINNDIHANTQQLFANTNAGVLNNKDEHDKMLDTLTNALGNSDLENTIKANELEDIDKPKKKFNIDILINIALIIMIIVIFFLLYQSFR